MKYDEFKKAVDRIIEDEDTLMIHVSPDFQWDQTLGFPTSLCVCWEQVLLSSKIGPVLANNFPPQLLKNLFSVSEAPALIIKVQYLALMRQPVQQSCCEDSVAKKLRPAIKAFI